MPHISTASHPAAIAGTVASTVPYLALIALMPISSLSTRPLNPSYSFSIPVTTAGESVAGRSSSIAGMRMCAVMIDGDIGFDRGTEWNELDALDPVRRMLDDRQIVMRVDAGVAVSGKMLAGCGDPLRLERPDDDAADARDLVGALGQGTIANRRILQVREDVQDRRVIERDPDRRSSAASARANRATSLVVAAPAEGPHRRPDGERAFRRATRPPSWSVLTHRGSSVAIVLALACHLGDLLRLDDVAGEENDSAEIEFLREQLQIGGNRVSGKPRDCQLTDLATHILQGHCC